MLERIRLRYFQIHDDRVIEFDPRITVLTGPNDSGKTAVLRALQWACLNHPSGDSFVGKWRQSPFAKVTLDVDGKRIIRKKGSRTNEYRLDRKIFRAFGQGVPEEISQLLSVGPVNFAGQHDSIYWLTDTAGQVARNLNQVINLESIDRSLGHLASEVRRAKAEVEISQERLTTARREKNGLKWVIKFDHDLKQLEQLYTSLDKTRSKRARLSQLVEGIRTLDQRFVERSGARNSALKACVAAKEALTVGRRRQRLESILNKLSRTRDQINFPDFSQITRIRDKADRVAEQRRKLELLLDEIKEAGRKWKRTTKSVKEARVALAKFKLCPTCGRPMEKKTLSPSSHRTCTFLTSNPRSGPIPIGTT